MSQERNIIITNKAIYNLKKKSKFYLIKLLKEELIYRQLEVQLFQQ